jgi:hypothetical protein
MQPPAVHDAFLVVEIDVLVVVEEREIGCPRSETVLVG